MHIFSNPFSFPFQKTVTVNTWVGGGFCVRFSNPFSVLQFADLKGLKKGVVLDWEILPLLPLQYLMVYTNMKAIIEQLCFSFNMKAHSE